MVLLNPSQAGHNHSIGSLQVQGVSHASFSFCLQGNKVVGGSQEKCLCHATLALSQWGGGGSKGTRGAEQAVGAK